jgi:phage N-6-adenine-methyltransferase
VTVNPGLFTSGNNDYGTPADFYARLDAEFRFQLDAAAWDWNAKAPAWLTVFDDALSLDWTWVCREVLGVPPVIWLNPPYSHPICGQFMAKAHLEGSRGATVVCLVAARTDNRWWHSFAMRSLEVRLVEGRLSFEGGDTTAPFPSAVVVFGPGQETPVFSSVRADGQGRLL